MKERGKRVCETVTLQEEEQMKMSDWAREGVDV